MPDEYLDSGETLNIPRTSTPPRLLWSLCESPLGTDIPGKPGRQVGRKARGQPVEVLP